MKIIDIGWCPKNELEGYLRPPDGTDWHAVMTFSLDDGSRVTASDYIDRLVEAKLKERGL